MNILRSELSFFQLNIFIFPLTFTPSFIKMKFESIFSFSSLQKKIQQNTS